MLAIQIVIVCAFAFTMRSQVSSNKEDIKDHELRIRYIESAVMDFKHLKDDVSDIKKAVSDYTKQGCSK